MRFLKIKATARCKLYFHEYVGRRAYSAINLNQPGVVGPSAGSILPGSQASISPPSEWVSKKELLRRLNVGETFFDGLMKRGKIPHRRYSRKLLRFDPIAVEVALATYDVGGGA
jgi:hypothetical protein